MNEKSSFSERVIEAGWLVLAAGVPLCFAPWGRNPFELPKAVLLWAVAAVMAVAWLAQGRRTGVRTPQQPPGKARCVWQVGVLSFLGVSLLATLFSANRLQSAQGSYDRMQGTITLLSYLVLMLLVAGQLRRKVQVHRLLTAIAWGSVPIVAYGLAQAAGLDPIDWRVEGPPVISTLGRSNFLGAYLVLVLPVTLVTAWRAKGRWGRVAYVALIGAQLACLALTRTRAAWLGALAAVGVLLLAAAWTRGHRRHLGAVVAVAVASLLAGLVALALIPGLTGSLGARSTIWQATRELIAGRPLLGYGPETLGQVFTSVYPPELVYVQGRAVRVDRAHNLLLDTLASIGVAGLLAYGLLVGAAIAAGVRAFVLATDSHVRLALAGILAAVAGHLVETQFSFPVTSTATIFWLFLGVLVASRSLVPESTAPAPGLPMRTSWLRVLLGALLIVTLLPAVLSRLAADLYAGSATRTGSPAELQDSIAAQEKATRLWPGQSVYHQQLSWLHLQAALLGDDPPVRFRAAEAELDLARRLTPNDYRVWAGYGELYLEWARAAQPVRFARAEDAYRQATMLFPGSGMLHTGWGLVYLAQNRLPEAAEQFHQAVGLDHTDHWAFWHLGNALLVQGDLEGAEAAYLQARRWAPSMPGAHLGLGHVYSRSGLSGPAQKAFQRALDLAPDSPGLHLDVARGYRDLGQMELACETAERGLLLEPSNSELLAFRSTCIEWSKGGG